LFTNLSFAVNTLLSVSGTGVKSTHRSDLRISGNRFGTELITKWYSARKRSPNCLISCTTSKDWHQFDIQQPAQVGVLGRGPFALHSFGQT